MSSSLLELWGCVDGIILRLMLTIIVIVMSTIIVECRFLLAFRVVHVKSELWNLVGELQVYCPRLLFL